MHYAPGGPCPECPGAGRNTEVNSQTSEKKTRGFFGFFGAF